MRFVLPPTTLYRYKRRVTHRHQSDYVWSYGVVFCEVVAVGQYKPCDAGRPRGVPVRSGPGASPYVSPLSTSGAVHLGLPPPLPVNYRSNHLELISRAARPAHTNRLTDAASTHTHRGEGERRGPRRYSPRHRHLCKPPPYPSPHPTRQSCDEAVIGWSQIIHSKYQENTAAFPFRQHLRRNVARMA